MQQLAIDATSIFILQYLCALLLSFGLLLMDLLQLLIPLLLLQIWLLWASQVPNAIGRVGLVESETSTICKRWDGNEFQDYILVFHRKKMGWKSDIAVIPFSFRSSAWRCPFPTSCTLPALRGQREKQERPWCCGNTAQQYVKLQCPITIVLVTNVIHSTMQALPFGIGRSTTQQEVWEAWLKLRARSSCSDLQSGWLNLKVYTTGHSWKLWGKCYL